MMKTERLLQNERMLKAVTGMGRKEFESLLDSFAWNLNENLRIRHKERKCVNKFGQGTNKGVLKDVETKLLFILIYLKTYPTYDLLGAIFDMTRTPVFEAIHFLKKSLEQTLGRLQVLPKRKISTMEELLREFPEMKEVFIDGTERPTQRKKNPKANKKTYSGKKKANTRKNIVVTGKGKTGNQREILILTKTKSGRRHDKNLADKEMLFEKLPKEWDKYHDSGFLGSQKQTENIIQPTKASKNHPLTPEQKQENSLISSIRVTVEHAIGGFKRFDCLTSKYRNKLPNFDDELILLASGLWNYHLLLKA